MITRENVVNMCFIARIKPYSIKSVVDWPGFSMIIYGLVFRIFIHKARY